LSGHTLTAGQSTGGATVAQLPHMHNLVAAVLHRNDAPSARPAGAGVGIISHATPRDSFYTNTRGE